LLKSNTALSLQITPTLLKFFFKLIKCQNIFTATQARFLPKAPTQISRLNPDFHQRLTPTHPTIGATKASFAFLATSQYPSELDFFCTLHEWSTPTV
jgi:hypothetical protein